MLEAAASALVQLFTPYYFMLFLVGIFMGLVVRTHPRNGWDGRIGPDPSLHHEARCRRGASSCDGFSIPCSYIGFHSRDPHWRTGFGLCRGDDDGWLSHGQKGEAGRALGIAFTASAIGGVFGAVLIAVSIPILKPLVLFLETPEFLALSVLAISAVSVLGGGSILKGIGAAGIGLLLAMIGEDPIRFVARWNFGIRLFAQQH